MGFVIIGIEILIFLFCFLSIILIIIVVQRSYAISGGRREREAKTKHERARLNRKFASKTKWKRRKMCSARNRANIIPLRTRFASTFHFHSLFISLFFSSFRSALFTNAAHLVLSEYIFISFFSFLDFAVISRFLFIFVRFISGQQRFPHRLNSKRKSSAKRAERVFHSATRKRILSNN